MSWAAPLISRNALSRFATASSIQGLCRSRASSPGGCTCKGAPPPFPARRIYYRFLRDLLGTCCRYVVITGGNHQLVKADVMEWLGNCRQSYDLVFCDPPTFSNSASAEDFDVQKDHVALLHAIVGLLAPGGVCYFSNNFRKFRFDLAAVSEFAAVEDISAQTIAPDFERNPKIHRCWKLGKK